MKKILKAINALRINKAPQSSEMHLYLKEALDSIKDNSKLKTLFLRNLFFILSIQRKHYLYKELGINGKPIGSQEFISARIIYNFLMKYEKKWVRDNLQMFFQFCSWKLLLYNQVTTSRGNSKTPAKLIRYETTINDVKSLADLIVRMIRRNHITIPLMAKWLPKVTPSIYRYSKLVSNKDGQFIFKLSGTVNGKKVRGKVKVKKGDVIIYKRKMGRDAIIRRDLNMTLVKAICKRMEWELIDYCAFRSEHLKMTPENLFSSGDIRKMSRADFLAWMGNLSAGQQMVTARRLTNKVNDVITPDPKWGNPGLWYMEWYKNEEKTAKVNRKLITNNKRTIRSATKTTGLQTIDLLSDMHSGRKTTGEINTLHTNLMARLDMAVPVYTVIDGSGSMLSPLGSRSWNGMQVDSKYAHLRYLDVACTLALSFMMKNPEPRFKESFTWFSNEAQIVEHAVFKNPNVDSFLSRTMRRTAQYKVIDHTRPFSENLQALKGANPMKANSTNIGSVVTKFLSLKVPTEQLPHILLFITDEINVPCYRKVA